MNAQSGSEDPAEILGRLLACLDDLDRINAPLAAVHLSTAIEQLRLQFGFEDATTEGE